MVGTYIEYFCKNETLVELNTIFLEILKLDETHVLREKLTRETDNLLNIFI